MTQRDRFLEILATLGDWADLVYDEESPAEVVRVIMAFGFLTGLLTAQEQPQLAAAILTGASEEIPDAVTMARELAERMAQEHVPGR